MSIRVIAGTAKGRRLKLVPGDSTRPVMDRVKESLFNIIGRDVINAAWLDLFAGTGSVGIEALSRGAAVAVFIDLNKLAVKTIHENLVIARLSEKAAVRRLDVLELLKRQPDQVYDYIYVAPPQYQGLWLQTLQALVANPVWIPDGTVVIVQIDPSEREPVDLARLVLEDERQYGKTLLLFYRAVEPKIDEASDA